MTLTERIAKDMTESMKARDQARLSALRMAKAALMNGEVSKGRALEEGEALQVLASLIKQRRDSIDQFGKAGRTDLVEKERAELAVLEQLRAARGRRRRPRAGGRRRHTRDGRHGTQRHGARDEGRDELAGRPHPSTEKPSTNWCERNSA